MNLMTGAALTTRVNWLRQQGISLPTGVERYYPLNLSKILQLIENEV
jgi:hypothetical protein